MKKQIVFIEYFPTIHGYKMAKGLRDTGKYETVLISFNRVDRKFFGASYDKIINLELGQKINLKNLFSLFRRVISGDGKQFFMEIKSLRPYIVEVNNLDLLTRLTLFLIDKKVPKIYYAYDILAFYNKKKFSMREHFLKKIEKYYFKKTDGILHKGPRGELAFLDFSVNIPDLAVLPGCLEDWTFHPKKKNMKEIHVVYAGSPFTVPWMIPLAEIMQKITAQGIHFHTYGKCGTELENKFFLNEEKNNPYFHFHNTKNVRELNKEMSNYHYGIIPQFFYPSLIDSRWIKTTMSNKMFNYLEAGLPIIIGKQGKVMVDVSNKYGLGICIDYKDIPDLKKILSSVNYRKLQQNVKKVQRELSIGNLTGELECFYEKVAERKTKSMR